MGSIPIWYLFCGILIIACGFTLMAVGVSRIIAARVSKELQK